ncbi:hypothetical protein [Micromonospora sp. WMMD1274]|uniref:hypothetical protein n=1 Tax=Micromonospora sp. WMMD1274 TaxID=3404116 RepID=UPI003B95DCFB
MMDLFPTPARLDLLDQVNAGNVFRDAIGESYISGDRKVTHAIHEMQAASWVTLDAAGSLDYWRLTRLGRAVRAVRLMDYGTHVVAETGPTDDPTFIGEVRPDLADPGRWVVLVGADTATGLRRQVAVASLRGMAVQALVDLEHDALDGAA